MGNLTFFIMLSIITVIILGIYSIVNARRIEKIKRELLNIKHEVKSNAMLNNNKQNPVFSIKKINNLLRLTGYDRLDATEKHRH